MGKVQEKVIKLKCKETGLILYTRKNKKQNPDKMVLKKYNKKLRRRTEFKESNK